MSDQQPESTDRTPDAAMQQQILQHLTASASSAPQQLNADKNENINEMQAATNPYSAMADESGKLTKKVYCPKCSCLIMRPKMGALTQKEIFLHYSRQRPGTPVDTSGETYQWYWQVNDIFDYDNIGFTKDVPVNAANNNTSSSSSNNNAPTVKYLTCADCESNVLGIQYLSEGKRSYLCCSRVDYK